MGCLESNGSEALGPLADPQSGTRPWVVPMHPRRAWPRTAWGLAAVGTLPRVVEALSLTPSPLHRVKFLLMDTRGSPQAETRWSDPIALHQGSAGGGGALTPVDPCGLVTHPTPHPRQMVMLSRPLLLLPGDWGPGGSVQVQPIPQTEPRAGEVGHRVSLIGRDTSSVHAQMLVSPWVPRSQPSRGQKQPSP